MLTNIVNGDSSATMDDIAAKVGVSKATVSYALSGKKKVSREIEERVFKAAEDLSYQPQLAAPKLSKLNQNIIGICIPIESNKLSDDLYHYPVIEGAMDKAHKEGFQLLVNRIVVGDKTSENAFYRSLRIADGVILANPRKDHIYENTLRKAKIPYVLHGTPEKGELNSLFYVDIDLIGAGFQAVQHLFASGHRNIFYVHMSKAFLQTQQRIEGYKLAHEEAGVPWNEDGACYLNVNTDEVHRVVGHILREKGNAITGFVAANDILAIGVLRALQEAKITVPQKVAVISMGSAFFSEFGHPKLTTIDFSPYRCGYESAGMLIDIITRRRIKPTHMLIPGKLVIGETT